MQDIEPLFQEALEICQVFFCIHLRGARIRTIHHRLIELVEGHGLAEVVQHVLPVQLVMETDVMDAAPFKVLFCQVRC